MHAPPLTMPGNGRICPAFFFPSLLAVRTTVTCKRGKKHNAKLPTLSFFQIYSLLSSLSGFLFFPSSGGRSAGFFSPSSVGRSGGAAVSQLQ